MSIYKAIQFNTTTNLCDVTAMFTPDLIYTNVTVPAGEAIPANSVVSLVNVSGTVKAFLATANHLTPPKPANGYTLTAAVNVNDPITVYFIGQFVAPGPGFTVANVGQLVYLSVTPGKVTVTPPTNPDLIESDGAIIAVDGSGNATISFFTAAVGAGEVTSVALTLPADTFSVTGSPVTSAGTLIGAYLSQPANFFHVGPISGGSAQPTWRVIDIDDLFGGVNADNTTFLRGDGTWQTPPPTLPSLPFSSLQYYGAGAVFKGANIGYDGANLVNLDALPSINFTTIGAGTDSFRFASNPSTGTSIALQSTGATPATGMHVSINNTGNGSIAACFIAQGDASGDSSENIGYSANVDANNNNAQVYGVQSAVGTQPFTGGDFSPRGEVIPFDGIINLRQTSNTAVAAEVSYFRARTIITSGAVAALAYGLHVNDLIGIGTTETAAIKIETQTGGGSGLVVANLAGSSFAIKTGTGIVDVSASITHIGELKDSSGSPGTSGQMLTSTVTGTAWVAAGGGGTPGGSDKQIQFNDGGAFNGIAVSIWDKTLQTLEFATLLNGSFIDLNAQNTAATLSARLNLVPGTATLSATNSVAVTTAFTTTKARIVADTVVTTTYSTSVANDFIVRANSAVPFTITLTTTGAAVGQLFRVKNINTGAVTVVGQTGNIDGVASKVLNQYDAAEFEWDGTNWNVF